MMSGKRTSGFYEWCVVHAEFVLGAFGREPVSMERQCFECHP
jgi:hypothetical protein